MNVSTSHTAHKVNAATAFDHPEFRNHEQIVFGHEPVTGLKTIIAIHDTRLGPAAGGCRMWRYACNADALTDALRLSRGMTYKNALAGLDLGGGKAVIIADPSTDKTEALLEAFGTQVDNLSGRYLTAEDVGISSADMDVVGRRTTYALGTSRTGLGDPSPYTALGVFEGIKAAMRYRLQKDDPTGLIVSVQGLGNVGFAVIRYLHKAGAKLVVSDINTASVERAVESFGAKSIVPTRAHEVDADIFCPCALGAGLNSVTIPEIRAKIVAGAANNQLATDEDGERLRRAGILYAPDYAINAGGIISIALAGPRDEDTLVREKTVAIGDTLTRIFERADAEDRPTQVVADELAEERLAAAPLSR
ncbi:Glu/Leu/Phe/Val dehydrogenase dimerization domain-containing protein [Breoghania sp.]|uniref:Leu/Phe/Val dehydrogenase n=1 Tax=Breoghania sp. TaxID=2065378 RepID=UPI00260FB264|nr:Glu/Leu/Phe/Val dehydrogenase dimerization domain-containing protein [Breoghania sp.]MDJ0930432.1 Glu/Leu/Phe/Val dehydrogenase dimerization domain-containing protein [Breoghania sp.]